MWLPDHEDLQRIHQELTVIFEAEDDPISPPGVKSLPLLESACNRPLTGMGGVDKYESPEEKIAALFHSLTKNHAFHNGNKRTALVSMLTTLSRNGKRLDAKVSDDEIYDFVVAVTADEYPHLDHGLDADGIVDVLATWIRQHWVTVNARPSAMKLSEFIAKCEQAGGSCKEASGGAYVIRYNTKSIRVSQDTRQLDGMAVMSYLRTLGLSESNAGISFSEFQDGYSGDREQIYRYMAALKRLAKT
ncbi:type II toxin-antitoxin system death-on-curing family toxin [Pseudomonas bohemica]|uniref:type II toxin-antitoxin system death-on-curing family toxin n=1 Tax=Pseudomonas bohemica TaxID=2044872 RepID=UPI000DA5EEE4|nr:type II toxin-antitoxin system death-on-curing family toxin [Pseudomonas bohemica]